MIEQLVIAVFGVTAVFLSQDGRASRRLWAPVFGLLSQPFWFYATWRAEQWGVFVLSLLYAAAWARGFWIQWISAARTPR